MSSFFLYLEKKPLLLFNAIYVSIITEFFYRYISIFSIQSPIHHYNNIYTWLVNCYWVLFSSIFYPALLGEIIIAQSKLHLRLFHQGTFSGTLT